jgi:hypothetical protein
MKTRTRTKPESSNPTVGTSPASSQPAPFLSRRQVADRWGVCVHTVAKNKSLTPVRFNPRLIRYRFSEVLAAESSTAA